MGERSKFSQLPGSFSLTFKLKDLGAGVAEENPLFRNGYGAPMALTGARLIKKASLTGHAANYGTLSVINKGGDGTGTTSMASKAFDTPGDDDVVAFGSADIDLSTDEGDTDVAPGDVLAFDKAVAGAGMALADDLIELTFEFKG